MSIGSIVTLVGAAVLLSYVALIYNGLVQLKHNMAQAWANIDVLLKQRYDEVPKLVTLCKEYMRHEAEVLERVILARRQAQAARSGGNLDRLSDAETALQKGLGSLFAVAEAYPDLKADRSFNHLRDRISALENTIADRREFYNESVNRNNVRIEQFPDVLIARWFRFKHGRLLKFAAEETRDLNLKALFD
jgi:LemA protein